MGITYIFGPSGSGKSHTIHTLILEEARKRPSENFYILVPDQYTMQTQKELVELSKDKGILNVDILSFGRLSYRVMEETGGGDIPVLDDTGKNLILRLVAGQKEEELTALKGHISQMGYIHEVKSSISEFMQYRIDQNTLQDMIVFAGKRGALTGKLKDLSVLYAGFTDYIRDHYITREESMEVLARQIPKSKKCKGATFVFDGFTGFTPVQHDVIEQLMMTAGELYFNFTIDEKTDPYQMEGEQKLFAMTQKAVHVLSELAGQAGVEVHDAIWVKQEDKDRFASAKALRHLEQNLFRYPYKTWKDDQQEIRIRELESIKQEAAFAAREIKKLVREEGLAYRDIAVVCGDLESYAGQLRTEMDQMGIPYFLDSTGGILLNPFVEYIRSALQMVIQDFSRESVNHYLRSGMTGIPREEVDLFDVYLRKTGIRGRSRFEKLFTRPMQEIREGVTSEEVKEKAFAELERINAVRSRVLEQVDGLKNMGKSASDKVRSLYQVIADLQIQEKLYQAEMEFQAKGEFAKAKEYHQIYPYIIDLLSQIDTLLGKEEVSLEEFSEILDAGFTEMRVGMIPQSIDKVVVGDLERSRVGNIKVLFFLGCNDGNIPKQGGSGGIISDIDREFLSTSPWELAPSPRQKMYIQRFYLYLSLTKPSEKLYVSFSDCDLDGNTMRPSYLIDVLRKLYPGIAVQKGMEKSIEELETWEDGMTYLADCLREAAGHAYEDNSEKMKELRSLLALFQDYQPERMRSLGNAAFLHFKKLTLEDKLALRLYGERLQGSITRMEKYSACAYAHFLQYGIRLKEKEEFGFEAVDMGSIMHEVLDLFSKELPKKGYTWKTFPKDEGYKMVDAILDSQTAGYGHGVLYDTASSMYQLERIRRVLHRTLDTVQYQIGQGDFLPEAFEKTFRVEQDRFSLIGKIDRLDSYTDGDDVKLAVLDYKSGNKDFDYVEFFNGLQLQLMTYLYAAREEKAKDLGHAPGLAGAFYYHLDDPIVEVDRPVVAEEAEELQRSAMKLKGLACENPAVIAHIDATPGSKLTVLPLSKNKDGSFRESKMLVSEEHLESFADYAVWKMAHFADEIYGGQVTPNPYQYGNKSACTYCAYKAVCPFEAKIPGCKMRDLIKTDKETILNQIEEEKGN